MASLARAPTRQHANRPALLYLRQEAQCPPSDRPCMPIDKAAVSDGLERPNLQTNSGMPRPTVWSHAHPRGTMRTAAACSISDSKPRVLQATAHACRSIGLPFPTAWRGRFLVRTVRSRGPPVRSRHSPSAGVEPPSARTHSNRTRIRSNPVRRSRRAPHCTLHCWRRCRPLGARVGST